VRTADGLLVLGPDDGDRNPGGDIVRKSQASDGDGRWGAVVVSGVPGEGGQTHRHAGEAEGFFILQGQVELLGVESVSPLSAGAFVVVPPDTEHGIRIVGDGPARWLAIWPAALDGFIEDLQAAGPDADRVALATIRTRHGIGPGRDRRRER
jgi:quercetin dioxygenase-like cupin family protein